MPERPGAGTRPHPSLNALLLCDHTIREAGTGKVSLIGVFENISAPRFPVVHRALSVYAKLGDAEGEFRLYADDRFVAGKAFTVVQAPAAS